MVFVTPVPSTQAKYSIILMALKRAKIIRMFRVPTGKVKPNYGSSRYMCFASVQLVFKQNRNNRGHNSH